MLTGELGLPGHCTVLLWRISLGEGMLGPIGVEHISSNRCSKVSQEKLSMVLMVQTLHSIKLLDLRKWGGSDVVSVMVL